MKIKHACGLLAVLLLFASLVPYPVQADSALEWTEVDKPGLEGNIIVTPSEVSEIAIGSNGVLYALDSENSKVYRSLNAGVSWEDISTHLVDAGAELPASKIAIAPDNEGIVAVVTDSGSAVYISLDGGMSWDDTNMPALTGDIQAIAISAKYTEGQKTYRELAVGTAVWGDNVTSGQLWVLKGGSMWASWKNQDLAIGPSCEGGEVSALAYSPDYNDDRTVLVVASTSSDVAADYQNKTWLCLGERDTEVGTTSWDSFESYPVEIVAVGDAADVARIKSSLALPSNYSSEDELSRRLFVSYDREPDDGDDVYLIKGDTLYRLDANDGADINIASISYHGTMDSGTLLAGDADPVAGTFTVQVRRTENPFDDTPTWDTSSVPPTGPGNAKLSWSPDGKLAYCGTSKPPGVVLGEPDESAFSASLDGDKWRQMGLMDTVFQLADIAVAPDSGFLFVTSSSTFGPEGIWRSFSDQLGKSWERVLTMDTDTNAVIVRLSPDYNNDHTLYAAEVGGEQIAVSHNRGNSWQWRHAPGPIVDLAVEDEGTIYTALPGGEVAKSTDGGWRWEEPVETTLADINMLAVVDEETILVGGRNGDVAYSTDGGESFTQVGDAIGSGSGDVQVIADADFSENGIIYAATNLPDEGLWRYIVGISDEWEQLDEDITELAEGQRISGLAVGPEGTLYALRSEPAGDTTGGMTRWLCPSCCQECMDFEYDLINFSLPRGAAFNSTAVFPNTLPYLKLSGDAEQNELWAVDTASQTIYRFQDTLCKFGPSLDAPADGAIISLGPCPCERPPRLILEWGELEDVTEYEVAMYLDADSASEVWTVHNDHEVVIATGCDDPVPLSSGTAYYWQARADAPIKRPWSEIRSFALAFMEVEGLYPVPGATGVSVRPAFTWDSVARATGYEFVLARDSEFTDVVVAIDGADALQTTAWGWDRDLEYATTYFWKVRAISATSCSEWGIGVFTTETALIALPQPQSSSTPSLPEPMPSVPFYLLVIIGLGVTLFIVLLVLIIRTGR